MLPLFDPLRLVLCCGKGGVGKTTISCALAAAWAQRFPQERVLLLSTDPAHSIADVLQCAIAAEATPIPGYDNFAARALDAEQLQQAFRDRHAAWLETAIERGSLLEGADLSPVWDFRWPGLDELMGLLEITHLLAAKACDRLVVDMAPTGHALNLLGLDDFLNNLIAALTQFQAKHQTVARSLAGRYVPDDVDRELAALRHQQEAGHRLLRDRQTTACWTIAIPEPMSLLETQRLVAQLAAMGIPWGGLLVNRVRSHGNPNGDRYTEQQRVLQQFRELAGARPAFVLPLQAREPLGTAALTALWPQVQPLVVDPDPISTPISWPMPLSPGLPDILAEGKRLAIVGGKGGVGKTTIAAALAVGLAQRHRDRHVLVMSIDPAHSLGDALGLSLGHEPTAIALPEGGHLSACEVNGAIVSERFRQEYLRDLAGMLGGAGDDRAGMRLAYLPEAWQQLADRALPGIDELLSLLAVADLLEAGQQDLVVLDTAPTGHLLRFLEMPAALEEWLTWILRLWLKYQEVAGHVDLVGRLRELRQRVLRLQALLTDPDKTEFIGVVRSGVAILSEQVRLARSLDRLGVCQRCIVWNDCTPGALDPVPKELQGFQIVRLPSLPRSVAPMARIVGAARLLLAASAEAR